MTTIPGIPSSSTAWADRPTAKSSASTGSTGSTGGVSEFQAALDKTESRAKSTTGTTDTADDTTRTLALLDNNSSTRLNQSEYDNGSASTTEAASRLPAPPALFTADATDNTSDTSTLTRLFDKVDGNASGSIDDNETATLQQMTQAALDAVPPTAVGFSSITVSTSDGSDKAPVSTSDQAISQSYDMNQLAQQVLRQYQQVGSGTSTASATGNSVDAVA